MDEIKRVYRPTNKLAPHKMVPDKEPSNIRYFVDKKTQEVRKEAKERVRRAGIFSCP